MTESLVKNDVIIFLSGIHTTEGVINKTGDDEYHLSGNGVGFHTVNNKGELFYIDSSNNINKLLKDFKTPAIFIQTTDSTWEPLCVYWCLFTGELLVGMRAESKDTFKVNRYSQNGQLKKQYSTITQN